MAYTSTARLGIHGVGLIVEELGWIFRELVVEDWGIDALMEVVDDGRPTGRLIAVQIKAGESWFKEANDQGFVYRGTRRHLAYWRGYSLPVVLVLYNPVSHLAFWQIVRDELIEETTQAWKLVVPKSQSICRASLDSLRAVALSNIDFPTTPRKATAAPETLEKRNQTVLHFLDSQIGLLAELPAYFEKGFKFETVRQRVRVSQRRLTHRDFKAREDEATQRSGYFLKEAHSGLGYFLRGAEMYSAADSGAAISSWDELREKLHRGVILGDPGFGKTWLLKHEGLRLAKTQANELRCGNSNADEIVLPIFIRLGGLAKQLTNGEHDIQEAIANIVALTSTLTPEWVACQIENGHALLLLDALDEVDPHSRQTLNDALTRLAQTTKSRILLSSRIAGYQRPFDLSGTDAEREVEIIAFDTDQVRGFINTWFESAPQRGRDLLDTLFAKSSLGGLARIPILLSFMCLLAKQDDQLPSKRVQLYETLLSHLLEGQWREEALREKNADRIEAKLFLLEEIAWYFSAQSPDGKWHDLMSSDELAGIIMKSRHAAFLRETAQHELGILWELSERDGILVKAGMSSGQSERQVPYLFLHRTFHEYLLASYLARLETDKWTSEVQKHLWYDVDWEEPIVLLAGRLTDWRSLLGVFANEENDVFNRMLILAGRCLGEVGYGKDANTKRTGIEAALRKLLNSESFTEKRQARRALVMMHNPEAESLVAEAYAHDSKVRSDIASDLVQFNPVHALSVFKQGINSENPYTRRAAIANIAELDNEEARGIVSAALDDPDLDVRAAAAEAIGDLDNDKVARAFREQLILKDSWGRSALIHKISEKGGANAVTLLAEVLEYSDRFTRRNATEGLAKIGSQEALSVLRNALSHRRINVRFDAAGAILDKAPEVSLTVLKSALTYEGLLSEMVRLSPELEVNLPVRISIVVKYLHKDVETLRTPFLDSSSLYGGEAAFSFLVGALSHEHQGVQWIAAKLLCEISSSNFGSKLRHSVTRPPRVPKGKRAFLSYALAILLNSRNSRTFFKKGLKFEYMSFLLSSALVANSTKVGEVERALVDFRDSLSAPEDALWALGRAEDPNAVDVLIDGLKSPFPSYRKRVIDALGISKVPQARRGLIMALDDPVIQVRLKAAAALKEKSSAKVWSVLSGALTDPDVGVRWNALRALEKIGGEDVLKLITPALTDPDKEVRWHAANTLAKSGDARSMPVLEEELLQKDWPWTNNSEAAKLLGEIGSPQAISSLIRGIHSHWGAYINSARALGDFARGDSAVRACEQILRHWPNYFSRKREVAYDVISELAPEVRWAVGDEWPIWRARIMRRIAPPPGILSKILIKILIIPFVILGVFVRAARILGRKLRGR